MSGTAIEIYLKTIATGDGARKTAQDYAQVVNAAKTASREMAAAARQAAQEQTKAAKDAAAAVKKAEAEKSAASKKTAQEQAQAAKQAASVQKKAAEEAAAAAKKAAQEQAQAAKQAADATARAATGQAQGILEISRAVEDAQFGIRGVLNNIPQMVTQFGGGAALAGGISLAAVGLTTLLPMLSDWLGITAKLDEALGGTAAALKEQADAAMQGLVPAEEAAEAASKKFEAQLRKEQAAIDANNRSMAFKIEMLKLSNSIQSAADKAKLEFDIQDIKAKKLPPQEEARQIAQARMNNNQASKDRAQNELVAEINQASQRTTTAAVNYDAAKNNREQLEKQREDSRRGWSYQGQQGNDQTAMDKAKLKSDWAQGNLSDTSGMAPENIAALQRAAERSLAEYNQLKEIFEGRQQELAAIKQKYGGVIPAAPDENVLGSARNMEIQRKAELETERNNQHEVNQKAAIENPKIHSEFENTHREIARDYTGVALPAAQMLNGGALPVAPLPPSNIDGIFTKLPQTVTRPLLPGESAMHAPAGLQFEAAPLPPAFGGSMVPTGLPLPSPPTGQAPVNSTPAAAGPPPGLLNVASSNDAVNKSIESLAATVVKSNNETMARLKKAEDQIKNGRTAVA